MWKSPLVTAAFLAMVTALALFLTRPPRPVSASAPSSEASSERAMLHVLAIAERPHPIGSEDHARVRDYVLHTLTDLGLEASIQRTTAVTAKYRAAGAVENVVARLRGTGGSGAVLLAAHYDSVAAGPGAGDDASGVAAILEAVRALKTGAPLVHDLVVLISDGEETGLLGASAFMAEHPWAKDVRVVVNLEARGNSGVSSLFETSAENGALVAAAAAAVPGLSGSSLAYEVYKRMPNDTDATVFKDRGAAALNFAFVGNWEAYHTPGDDPAHLNPGSLQQQCGAALGLARQLGNADLDHLAAPDAVFFSWPGGLFVHYPHGVGVALAFAALILFLGSARRSLRGKSATVRGLAGGFALLVIQIVVAAVGGLLIGHAAEVLHGRILPEGDVKTSAIYAWAVVLGSLGIWTCLLTFARRRLTVDDAAIGAALLLVGTAIATALLAPGLGYAFALPALAAAAPRHRVVTPLAALLAIATVVPLMLGVFEGLGVAGPGGALLGVLTALLSGAVVRSLDTALAPAPGRLALAPLATSLALFVVGMTATRTSVAHPKASRMFYVSDTDTGSTRWASSATRGDAWIDTFIGTHPESAPLFPGWTRPWRQHDAPHLDTTRPELRLVETTKTEGGRALMLHAIVGGAGRAQEGVLEIATDADVSNGLLNGKSIPRAASNQMWTVTFANVGPEGIDLRLEVLGMDPTRVTVTQRTRGLPSAADVTPRPAWAVPDHDGDQTVVRHTFRFE